jgi:hypothetical protein
MRAFKRLAQPDDIGDMVTSNDALCTGDTIHVDGGAKL